MFQIESQDDPKIRYRVILLRRTFISSLVIKQFSVLQNAYLTIAQREFDEHEKAEHAYNTQKNLMRCLAHACGPNYVLTENEDVSAPTQLALEIAA